MFQNWYVSINNLNYNINSTISSAYAYDPGSLHKKCNSNFDKDFSNALSLRVEISKISVSIGICNISSEDCGLFQCPSMTNITNLGSNLKGILVPDHFQSIFSLVSSPETNSSSEIKPTDISKLWIILETTAKGAVERNVQLMRKKYIFFCLENS